MKRVVVLAGLLLLGCGTKERDLALARLTSPSAKQRAEAVHALAKARGGDDTWAALSLAVRDGSPAVRTEAAAALAATRRDDAPDAISPLLRDPDDGVRIAAVHALAARCGERSSAYLRLAFERSGAAVREQIALALRQCGLDPAQTLQHEESDRRRKALDEIASPAAAVRARGAHELGLLGRDDDRARLLKLLDDRDGVAAAAAARALGQSGAQQAAPRIRALLDEGGEVAAAAAEALLALGPEAVAPAKTRLLALAAGAGDEAVPAAVAVTAGLAGPAVTTGGAAPADAARCAAALSARVAQAAALLAQRCPAAPLARALAAAKHRDALYEALLHADGPAPTIDTALSRLLRAGEADPRIPLLALRYRAAGAALLDALRREQAARAVQLAQDRRKPASDHDSAAEIAKTPAPGAPDKERYARLMGLLEERSGAQENKASAAARLDALLHGAPGSDRRAFVVEALRAVLALQPPGTARVAAAFAVDPDPAVSSAARSEPEPAPSRAPQQAPTDPRLALWSDDGAVRARACAAAGPSSAAVRALLAASDPERRVRDACASRNETAPRK